MATMLNAPAKKSRKVKKRMVASVWLIMALLMGGLTLVLWPISKAAALQAEDADTPEPLVKSAAIGIGQVTHIETLHELDNEVHPVSFDALVRDLRDYPPEFKDAKYLKKNKGKWTVQVMDVSEHDIITDYLTARDDRDKFAYFRYRDENNQSRYVLTYGAMKSPQMVMGAAKTIDFKLPANVRVLPEEIDRYLDMIDSYELSEPMRDLSINRARKVKLQPTKRELAAKRRAPKQERPSQASDKPQSRNDLQAKAASKPAPKAGSPSASPSTLDNTATAIKGSTDSRETISVKEKRNVIDSNATAKSKEGSGTTTGTSDATGSIEDSQPSTSATTAAIKGAKTAESSSKPSSSSDKPVIADTAMPLKPVKADSMKALIDEKAQ